MSPVLEVRDVRKAYGSQVAVRDVSFRLQPGSIFGLLGPNGAGKTSTIRMITGITFPDRGSIRLFGESQRAEHQNRIGYMPEERGLYKKLTVRGQLEYLGALKGLDRSTLKREIDSWLDRFEIRSWEKKKTNELSKGMQQKLQFIVTVLHDPDLLVLDEPLSGLDPVNAEIIDNAILDMRKQGKTILLSTHRMEQVEQLCDEIVLMNNGSVVLAGGVRELKRSSGRTLVSLRFDGPVELPSLSSDYTLREETPNEVLIELTPGVTPNDVLRSLAAYQTILKWEIVEPSIKELFLEAVEGNSQKQSLPTLS